MANYGEFKYSSIKGEKGTNWFVKIFKKNHANIVENYNFLTNLNDWSVPSFITHNSSGGADIASNVLSSIIAQTNDAIIDGQNYFVKIKVSNYVSGQFQFFVGGTGGTIINSNGVHFEQITAGTTNDQLFFGIAAETSLTIDFVIVSPIANWQEPTELNLSGEGFQVKWSGQGDTRQREYLTSECILTTFIENDTDEAFLYDIFEKGDKEYFIRIYKNGIQDTHLWWFGWVQPSFDRFSNEPYPYTANIIATDSIGVYKQRENDTLNSSSWNKAYRINNHINDFGTTMGLFNNSSTNFAPIPKNKKWFKTSIDWFMSGHTYQDNDPFYSYYTTQAAYRKDVEKKPLKFKKYDVLTGSLRTFNTVGFLSDGHYYFIQPNNKVATSGLIRTYSYQGSDNEIPTTGNIINESTLLGIDQSTNAILGGSTITFDPVLKTVTCDFINGESSFDVPFNTDLTTPFTAGLLQGDVLETGSLRIHIKAKHREVFNTNQINFPTSSYTLVNAGHQTTFSLQIKIGTGAGVRYLQEGAGTLEWRTDTNPVTITLVRGRGANTGGSLLNNGSSDYLTPLSIKNDDDLGVDLASDGVDANPCKIDLTNNIFTAITELRLAGDFPIPVVSGELTIQLTAINTYTPYLFSAGGFAGVISSVNYANQTPSTVTRTTLSGLGGENPNISLVGTDTVALNSDSIGLTFTSTQTDTDAFENLDLGEISVGQTTSGLANFQDSIFSVQYNTGTNSSPVMNTATQGFRADDTGSYINILQLLVNQFLALQTQPLEILQAQIQSANISPLKNIRYSINNDGNFKYYQFLGGTFSAQSEIMDGEWFKVAVGSNIIFNDPAPIEFTTLTPNPYDFVHNNILNNTTKIIDNATHNELGTTQTPITSGTATSSLVLVNNTKGKIYSGQKLLLTEFDGRNAIEVTTTSDVLTNDKTIPVISFTPLVDYPVGSRLTPLTYDLSNVITGGTTSPSGSNTEVQFNNSGSFGASADLTFDGSNLDLGPGTRIGKNSAYGDGSRLFQLSGPVLTLKGHSAAAQILNLDTTGASQEVRMAFKSAGTRRAYIESENGNNLKIASEYGGMAFYTGSNGNELERMSISSSGVVSIPGTFSPTDINTLGNVISGGSVVGFVLSTVKTNTVSANAGSTGEGTVIAEGTSYSGGNLTAGSTYYLTADPTTSSLMSWRITNATSAGGATGLLAVALGTAPNQGMLLRGLVVVSGIHGSTAVGSPLYLRTSDGLLSPLAPTATGNIVRIVGYLLQHTSTVGLSVIYFNPSQDFITLS